MWRFIRLAPPLLLAAYSAFAQPPQEQSFGPDITGLWQGSIGKQTVIACFDRDRDDGQGDSKYYYLRHGKPIQLVKAVDRKNSWTENIDDKQSGAWQFDSPSTSAMDGVWSDQSEKKLPIHLTRLTVIATAEEDIALKDNVCNSFSFYRPLAGAQDLVYKKTESMKGKQFRLIKTKKVLGAEKNLVLPSFNTIELLEPGANIVQMNRILRERYLDRLAKLNAGVEGGLSEFFEQVLEFTDGQLILDEEEWAAGYGISGLGRWTEVWDLKTGKLIDKSPIEVGPDPEPEPQTEQPKNK